MIYGTHLMIMQLILLVLLLLLSDPLAGRNETINMRWFRRSSETPQLLSLSPLRATTDALSISSAINIDDHHQQQQFDVASSPTKSFRSDTSSVADIFRSSRTPTRRSRIGKKVFFIRKERESLNGRIFRCNFHSITIAGHSINGREFVSIDIIAQIAFLPHTIMNFLDDLRPLLGK